MDTLALSCRGQDLISQRRAQDLNAQILNTHDSSAQALFEIAHNCSHDGHHVRRRNRQPSYAGHRRRRHLLRCPHTEQRLPQHFRPRSGKQHAKPKRSDERRGGKCKNSVRAGSVAQASAVTGSEGLYVCVLKIAGRRDVSSSWQHKKPPAQDQRQRNCQPVGHKRCPRVKYAGQTAPAEPVQDLPPNQCQKEWGQHRPEQTQRKCTDEQPACSGFSAKEGTFARVRRTGHPASGF